MDKKIPEKYLPKSLTPSQRKKQKKSIIEGKDRPKLKGLKSRRSSWTVMAHEYFGQAPSIYQIRDALGLKSIRPLKDIIKRGEKAYYTSGSRPNVSPEQWGRARLYAVVFGSEGARKADGDIIKKHNIGVLAKKKGGSKETDLIVERKQFPESYGLDAISIIEKMAFDPKQVQILGSMGIRSQQYASDFDCFEVVETNNMDSLAKKFKSMVKTLVNTPKTYIMDIKCGSINEWKVIDETAHITNGKLYGYNQREAKNKMKELLDDGVVSKKEYDFSVSLLVSNPNDKQLREIIKNLRFNVLRWTTKDVLKGFLELRDGTTITLADAMMGQSIFKMDIISLGTDQLYNEFSIIYDLRLKGRRVNKQSINVEKNIKQDIMFYSSADNWFKVLKRLFSLAQYRYSFKKNSQFKKVSDMLIQKLNSILNSDLGLLNQMLNEMEVLIMMLEEKMPVTKDIIKSHISSFIERIGKVWSISGIVKDNRELFNQLLSALQLKGDKLAERFDKIHEILKVLLNKKTKYIMDKEGLTKMIDNL